MLDLRIHAKFNQTLNQFNSTHWFRMSILAYLGKRHLNAQDKLNITEKIVTWCWNKIQWWYRFPHGDLWCSFESWQMMRSPKHQKWIDHPGYPSLTDEKARLVNRPIWPTILWGTMHHVNYDIFHTHMACQRFPHYHPCIGAVKKRDLPL